MIQEKSLVVYKNRPALVTSVGEKLHIAILNGEQLRVREKDVELIYHGPCVLIDLVACDTGIAGSVSDDVRGAWELLEDGVVSLKELAELVYGEYTARTSWAAYTLLRDGLYFSGDIDAIHGRKGDEVVADEQKRAEKQREVMARDCFVQRLRAGSTNPGCFPEDDTPDSRRFFQEIEALAYKRTDKSRTLKDLGSQETPQEAHRLLLSTGFWSPLVNPYPVRFGLSLVSAKALLVPPPVEERVDLTHLVSLAIDNAWSDDPDDAVSIEGNTLYVHIADPGASLVSGSVADIEARDRGATLYLPEGVSRMINPDALRYFALGLQSPSPALSFKLQLDDAGFITETEIIRSFVKVSRLTYAEADAMRGESAGFGPDIRRLFAIADRNMGRRLNTGAITIELPEAHIMVRGEELAITPIASHSSAGMVRECMLMAGEGAAEWALRRRLPFPYVTQELGDLPDEMLSGLAGAYQKRRCMRPRSLSTRPGAHSGLGLDIYTQVTSPLRRYTDLLAHQQIRAFLRNESPLSEDEVLLRLAAGEAGANAAIQAERMSRSHWTAVYLSDKKGSCWDAVALERRGGRMLFIIPELALETQVALKQNVEPNELVSLTLTQVKIPELEMTFVAE
ncbi:MAG: RNB domain-containing ribonuclease [Treponema sp.]|jgi:exoribonuclease-2|nr:RNB domain-containing ribonuclease [Treponema sp.]